MDMLRAAPKEEIRGRNGRGIEMAIKTSWVSLTSGQREELSELCRASCWRVIPQIELPKVFPERLRAKIDSALLITAETSTGGTYQVVSALRVDSKDRQVDVEPFGLIVHSSGASPYGVFLHHGDWEGRSEPPPEDFWDDVLANGVGDYFYARPPAGRNEGTLRELPIRHRGAFEAVVGAIRAQVDAK